MTSTVKIAVNRRTLAEFAADAATFAALEQLNAALKDLRHTDALLSRLLESVFDRIPAARGAIIQAGPRPGEFDSIASQGAPFLIETRIPAETLGDRVGILDAVCAVLCAPIGELSAVYVEAHTGESFTRQHLQLLIAMAAEAAVPLDYALQIDTLAVKNQELEEFAHVDHGLIGESPAIAEVRTFINRVAGSDSTILVLGEMGTGKDLVARAIHRSSRRSAGPIVAVNCAAIPEALIESELFGHERGAFSGAVALKKGKVEAANRGTLFLDEVGELKPQLQAALLRFLQEREFQRVGGTQTLHADVRIVAATNRDLEKAVEQGDFRADLYYRLAVITCRTPSLRQMREDIPRLAAHFIRERRYLRVVKGISDEALQSLIQYDWPGNVRHLQNAIEQALVLGSSEYIEPEDLPEAVIAGKADKTSAKGFEARVLEFKREIVKAALAETRGNYVEAARILEVTPSYMRRLARNLRLS